MRPAARAGERVWDGESRGGAGGGPGAGAEKAGLGVDRRVNCSAAVLVQVMLRQDTGEYACIAEDKVRYNLGEVKEELQAAMGLNTEEEGSALQVRGHLGEGRGCGVAGPFALITFAETICLGCCRRCAAASRTAPGGRTTTTRRSRTSGASERALHVLCVERAQRQFWSGAAREPCV